MERRPGEGLRIVQRGGRLIELVADGQLIETIESEEVLFGLDGFQSLRARVVDSSGTAWVQPVFSD